MGGRQTTVISVIGPDRGQVDTLIPALRARVPGYRFIAGAGPDAADGVLAVVPGTESAGEIVGAVRDAMGGCVLYTGGGPVREPGVTVVGWTEDPADPADLDRLSAVLRELWVDVPRWIADARRADADRGERVRVAVRLRAEQIASELLDPVPGQFMSGRETLDALFLARLRCVVLGHGVEWPHVRLAGDGEDRDPHDEDAPPTGARGRDGGADIPRSTSTMMLVAAVGAGLAAGAAVARMVGPVPGVLVGAVVAVGTAAVRWRMLAGARRSREAARGAARLRRRWAVTVTDVVSRLRVPSVADAVAREAVR